MIQRSITPKRRLIAHCFGLALAGAPGLFPALAAPEQFLPPAAPWHGASERLAVSATDPWATPSEKTGLIDSPNYDDTVAYLKRLVAASPLLALEEFGRSAQGRPLYVVIATQDAAHTPEALRASQRPTLLAQAGIHAGEIDGKDAGLMLLRDIAVRGRAGLLDRANFLFVPIFNVDGHERSSESNRPNQRGPVHQGWRTTAQNLNLNRDYLKADAPETQGMLALIHRWSPSLYLDLHVTDGLDYQYDITFGYNGDAESPAWSPRISSWLNAVYRPAAEAALKTAGHIPGPLVSERNEHDLSKGLVAGPMAARFSHGYGDLRHLPSVLVENHSLKTYRQRVLGTYVLLEASLDSLGAHAAELRSAIEADESARPASLPMNWTRGGGGSTNWDFLGVAFETYTSPASGRTEIRWLGTPKLYPRLPVTFGRAGIQLARPKAYWVPATKPEVISRLRAHGIRFESLPAARTARLEMYRLVDPQPQKAEGGTHPYEGRHTLQTKVKSESRTETFPAGSVRVPADQPLGDLAMVLLEPESQDSFFAWGFFLETLQRTEYIEGYVIAPMAERQLAEEPALKAAFDKRLADDPKFAADPAARLRWFYERSKFYDDRYLLYPVGIERGGSE